jgi:IS4 transposase
MALADSIPIRERLIELLPEDVVRRTAKETRLQRRLRKIDPVAFLWTLVFGFACSSDRTIAGLRRAFELAKACTLAPSSFYDRFTPALVAFLQSLVGYALDRALPTRSLGGRLRAFKDLVLIDSSIVTLHELLANAFKGCRTKGGKASLKLHVILSAVGAGPTTIKVTDGRSSDSRALTVGSWVKDRLLLFDLGYYRHALFAAIAVEGGYFLTRLKGCANPTIVAAHGSLKRCAKSLNGKSFKEASVLFDKQVVDLDVEAYIDGRNCCGPKAQWRVVGLWNEEAKRYHLYVTNLPRRFSATSVATIYKARWAVELFFKALKSEFELDAMPTRKQSIVEALLYASMLTFLASKTLQRAAMERLGETARRATDLRWARLVRCSALGLLLIVTGSVATRRAAEPLVATLLLHEAADPHVNRPSMVEVAEASRVPKSKRP